MTTKPTAKGRPAFVGGVPCFTLSQLVLEMFLPRLTAYLYASALPRTDGTVTDAQQTGKRFASQSETLTVGLNLRGLSAVQKQVVGVEQAFDRDAVECGEPVRDGGGTTVNRARLQVHVNGAADAYPLRDFLLHETHTVSTPAQTFGHIVDVGQGLVTPLKRLRLRQLARRNQAETVDVERGVIRHAVSVAAHDIQSVVDADKDAPFSF